jgi:diguanylate cyclase (GGDEF)-like protein
MRILIVDDCVDNVALLEFMLHRAGYTELVTAESAPAAFEMLGVDRHAGPESPVDAILMDIRMPEINGIEATRIIKSTGHLQDVPVIMVTAQTDDQALEQAFEVGAMDYVTKPLNRVQLLTRLKSALRLKHEMDIRKARERELEELAARLAAANATLQQISRVDSLTGLANRRYLDSFMKSEWRRAIRQRQPVSILMIDIDCFKAFNDSLGHPAGDACLKRVAGAIRKVLHRPSDFVARYGGEEFMLVLLDTEPEGAAHVAELIRRAVEELAIPHPASSAGDHVTVSIGVATGRPAFETRPDETIGVADRALYAAKRDGRNRVVLGNW